MLIWSVYTQSELYFELNSNRFILLYADWFFWTVDSVEQLKQKSQIDLQATDTNQLIISQWWEPLRGLHPFPVVRSHWDIFISSSVEEPVQDQKTQIRIITELKAFKNKNYPGRQTNWAQQTDWLKNKNIEHCDWLTKYCYCGGLCLHVCFVFYFISIGVSLFYLLR